MAKQPKWQKVAWKISDWVICISVTAFLAWFIITGRPTP